MCKIISVVITKCHFLIVCPTIVIEDILLHIN
jgi:hypothetical protein